jgi:Rrf2 family protein
MLTVSKKSQYGLRAMIQLAKNYKAERVLSVKTISEKEEIPFDFLEKIIAQLEKANLVKGKRGVSGGYFLAKSSKKISVYDIVSVLERNKKPVNCEFCQRIKKCASKNVWLKLEVSLNNTLQKIKLAELIVK